MTPESSGHSTSTTSLFASCPWTTRRPAPGPSLLHPRAPASTSARTPEWFSEIQRRTHLHTSITWPCTTWRLGGWCVLSAWRMCARTRRSWWRTSVNCRRASLRLLTASRQETDKRFLWSCRGSYKSSSKIRILFKTLIPPKSWVAVVLLALWTAGRKFILQKTINLSSLNIIVSLYCFQLNTGFLLLHKSVHPFCLRSAQCPNFF